jgi:hypothetical protein
MALQIERRVSRKPGFRAGKKDEGSGRQKSGDPRKMGAREAGKAAGKAKPPSGSQKNGRDEKNGRGEPTKPPRQGWEARGWENGSPDSVDATRGVPESFVLLLFTPEAKRVYPSADDARRVFAALGEGGQMTIPMEKTFWAEAFGMVVDRFGTSWMVNGPQIQA